MNTFAPSFKFVKQTITVTSSCEIKVQKSAIVFGLGPVKIKTQTITNVRVLHPLFIFFHKFPFMIYMYLSLYMIATESDITILKLILCKYIGVLLFILIYF